MFRREGLGPRPVKLLELYSAEGCPSCRRVRALLTELDIDYIHRACPRGPSENRKRLVQRGGKMQVPYLVDPNQGTGVELYESKNICEYLSTNYGGPKASATG
jgi:glutathione S-transferase